MTDRPSRSRTIRWTLIITLILTAFLALLQVTTFVPPALLPTQYHAIDANVWNVPGSQRSRKAENRTEFAHNSTPGQKKPNNPKQDPILRTLRDANLLDTLPDHELARLPSWKHLAKMYGTQPVVLGMETCQAYRDLVPPERRIVAPAGLFNTGTNALFINLSNNIRSIHTLWQVPWGKHRPAAVRGQHAASTMEAVNQTDVLPVVIVRDPLTWMHSMCKTPYAAHWKRPRRCPNLVIDNHDRLSLPNMALYEYFDPKYNVSTFAVKVFYDDENKPYWHSLVDLWNDWYRAYYNATYPRLLVRYEDLLWNSKEVMQHIAQCLGTRVQRDFHYQVNTAKDHGSGSGLIAAIAKTGDVKKRNTGFTTRDLTYIREELDRELMEQLAYMYP